MIVGFDMMVGALYTSGMLSFVVIFIAVAVLFVAFLAAPLWTMSGTLILFLWLMHREDQRRTL